MHRSNPIGLVCGVLFLAALCVLYVWSHPLPRRWQFWSTEAWLIAATACGFYLWRHGMQLRNLVRSVPTSRIASAPQGYVELAGRAASANRYFPGAGEFYLWRRTQIATRLRNSDFRAFPFNLFYTANSVEVSDNPFCIEDGSGTALILPLDAEVICSRRETDYDGDRKIIRESILDGDPLYVLGHFITIRQDVDVAATAEELVNDWKMDRDQIKRFDSNRDGYLSGRELLDMHRAARNIADQKAADAAETAGLNTLSRAPDGRRFVISTFLPEQLAGHYQWYLSVGLAMFLAALIGSVLFYRGFEFAT